MIHIQIVDDDKNALILLEKLLEKYDEIKIVGKYTNPIEALEALDSSKVDVVFLDINMPPHNGIEIANMYIDKDPNVEIVFVTAHSEYAIEAFDLNAVDYLLKPVQTTRLSETLDRLDISNDSSRPRSVYIRAMYGLDVILEEGKVVKWRTQKAKELFAYMWIHQGENVDKDVLLETLYPNWSKDKASDNFNTVLYQLRKSMQPSMPKDFIKYTNGNYRMTCNIPSDFETIKKIIKSPAFSKSIFNQLETLYTGKLLEIEGYDWVNYVALRLHHDVIKFLEHQLYLIPQNDSFYLEVCQFIYKLDPFNENNAHKILEYHALKNEVSQAFLFYEEFERKYVEELDVFPKISIDKYVNK